MILYAFILEKYSLYTEKSCKTYPHPAIPMTCSIYSICTSTCIRIMCMPWCHPLFGRDSEPSNTTAVWGGVYFTVFSRFFHALLGSLLILLGSLLILLGSSSRKSHGNFTVVFLHPHQLKGSENSRFLLSENGRSHWIYGANLENKMLTSSSALRGLCSEKLLFFATEHVFSTQEPWIFMLYVIKKMS